MRAYEFITETQTLEEGKWNEEFLKNLIRTLVAGIIAYGGLEAKRLTTDYDKSALDAIVKQISPPEQDKIVHIAKKAKKTKKIDAQDKADLMRILDRLPAK